MPDLVKVCKTCGNLGQHNQKQGHCKACERRYLHKKRYGIYEDALKSRQRGKCDICKTELLGGQQTVIDHCHRTGKIRGMLCAHCNRGLGLFKDRVFVLLKAALYLILGRLSPGERVRKIVKPIE